MSNKIIAGVNIDALVADAVAVATVAAPLLGANERLAMNVAVLAIQAVQAARNRGTDVSDTDLDAVLAADDRAAQADKTARAQPPGA